MVTLCFNELVGTELSNPQYFKKIKKIATSDSIILITGETGVGKSVLANWVAKNSYRSANKFIHANCGSYSEGMLASEIFGHVKGAFTSANIDHKGLFEQANNGTLFLDEITETTDEFQAMLLNVIEDNSIRRLGGEKNIPINVRVIVATNKDIINEISKGNFRKDLYQRIKTFQINILPLRNRISEIPKLVDYFINNLNRKNKTLIDQISKEALDVLLNYSWPGNIRELEKAIEHAVIMASSKMITIEDLPDDVVLNNTLKIPIQKTLSDQNFETESLNINPNINEACENTLNCCQSNTVINLKFSEAKNYFEKQYLEKLIKFTKGNIQEMSNLSGITRSNIYKKLDKYDLNVKTFRN